MPAPPPPSRSRAWLLPALLSAIVAVPVVVHVAANGAEAWAWRTGASGAEIRRSCGDCHEPDRAREFARSPADWERTVDGMLARRRGPPGEAPPDRDAIVGWLLAHRSADGPALFRHRCGRCHDRDVIEPYRALGDEAIALLIEQHVRQQNHAVQTWEGALIVGHLLATPHPSTLGEPGVAAEFQRACGVCHTPSFLYRSMCAPPRDHGAWVAMVERMRGKSPTLFSAGRSDALAAHCEAICASDLAAR